ncbi:AMP-binding protein [Sinorhizobium psoraleae]|uniref:AMP-binding protein n=1 Tax=Sinorhizobium psoraleae TaxID=520838 RepID=UPI0035E3E028
MPSQPDRSAGCQLPRQYRCELPIRALSYAALEQGANRIAHHLISKGVGLGHVVGILVERSCDLIISFLGVFEGGGRLSPSRPAFATPAPALYCAGRAGAATIITKTEFAEQALGKTDQD